MNTPSDRNPYQPPKADVTPPIQDFDAGVLIPNGRSVPIGNGIQWIGEGFRLFGRSPGIWIVNVILLFIMTMVLAFIPILGGLATNILMPVITAGIMLGCRSLENGEPLEVGHLFAGFKENAGQLVLVGVLTLVGTIVIFIVLGVVVVVMFGSGLMQNLGNSEAMVAWFLEHGLSMILLLVLIAFALFLPLGMAAFAAPALVVFHRMEALPAMKQSFMGCIKNILPFVLYVIILFVLGIIAILPLFLGMLVFTPMAYCAMYASYKDIHLEGQD